MILSLGKDSLTFELTDQTEELLEKSGYVGIYIVQLNKIDNPQIIKVFTTQYEGLFEESFEFPQDGYYTIAKIVIPDKETFEKEILLPDYNIYYYIDVNQKVSEKYGTYPIYKVTYEDGEKILEELVDLPELVEVNNSEGSGVKLYRELLEYFSTCYLYKCYVNICKQLFKDMFGVSNNGKRVPCSCRDKLDIDINIKYKRDLVQSTLSVIQYLVDCGRMLEAERVLERIGSCNGICPTANNEISKSRCGCHS